MSFLPDDCRSALGTIAEAAGKVWKEYQQKGPGRVAAEFFTPVEKAVRDWNNLIQRIRKEQTVGIDAEVLHEAEKAASVLHDFANRCCCRPEGLCFITGEAGLIPRRDLHQQFEEALDTVRRLSH